MSAHCEVCGTDLVYTEYSLMDCPVCVLRTRSAALEAALADREAQKRGLAAAAKRGLMAGNRLLEDELKGKGRQP